MTKESLNKYTMKITQANAGELLVIVYDIIIEDLQSAKEVMTAGDVREFSYTVRHGQRFLLELMNTLDHRYEISNELMSLYIYVNREMINAMIRNDASLLDNALMVLSKLREAFATLAKDDDSPALMSNVTQVYAGLTYGKGSLNELSVEDTNRGFKA